MADKDRSQERKRGKFSGYEKDLIVDMSNRGISDEDIAKEINRTVEMVEEYRKKQPHINKDNEVVDLVKVLQSKFYWEEIQEQLLDNKERVFFESTWSSLYSQFAATDITYTDEMMIRDLCMMDIHLNRCLKTKKQVLEQVNILEREMRLCDSEIDDEIERMNAVRNLSEQIVSLRMSLKGLTSEWKEMQEKKDKKFEQLKSTRAQKIELEEKSGRNFFDMLKLLDTYEKREQEGRMNEIIKLSSAKALSKFHEVTEFEDGSLDRPILTPEIVLKEKQDLAEEIKSE